MYVSVLLGFDFFLLQGSFYIGYRAAWLINSTLVSIKFFLLAGSLWNVYGRKLLIYIIPYTIIDVVFSILHFPPTLIQFVTPFVYLLIGVIVFSSWKNNVKRLLFIFVFYNLHITSVNWVRTEILINTFDAGTLYQQIILSLDSLMLLLIIYIVRRYMYVRHVQFLGRANINTAAFMEDIFPIEPTISPDDPVDSETAKELSELGILVPLIWVGQQLLVWMLILVIGHFVGNVLLETAIITLGYVMLGSIIQYRSHFAHCTKISVVVFFVAARVVPSVYYSQIIPIIMAATIVYCSYLIKVHFGKPPFRCENATEEEIKERATRCGFDDESINFLVKAHKSGLSYAELADMYNLTTSGVSKRKSRLTKKVESR